MCVQPLNIINPTNSYNPNINPCFVDVPCGECPDCVKRYQDDWAVRTFYEVEAVEIGGFACQMVLTYDEEHLPYALVDGYQLPIFEHYQVKKMLRTLSKRLSRSFDYSGMRYLIAEEFGSDNNHTHRQHYHLLLTFANVPRNSFNSFVFTYRDIYHWIRAYWYGKDSRSPDKIAFSYPDFLNHKKVSKKQIRKSWYDNHKGLVLPLIEDLDTKCPVSKYGKFCSYICKYVTKDFHYLHSPDVCAYLGITPDNPYLEIDGELVHYRKTDRYKDVKHFFPKHLQSMSWGSPYFDSDEFVNKSLDFDLLQKVRISTLCKSFPTPRYFINKLCYRNEFEGLYNYNGNKIYRRKLTDFGKEYMKWLKFCEIENNEKRLLQDLSINGISNITNDYLLSLNPMAKSNNLHTIYDVFDYCWRKLDGLSIHELAIYKTLYRYVNVLPENVLKMFDESYVCDFVNRLINNEDDYSYTIKDKVIDYENVKVDLFTDETVLKPISFKYAHFNSKCNFEKCQNVHITFSWLLNYDDVLSLLDSLRLQYNNNSICTKDIEDKRIQSISDKYNRPKNYGV